MSRNIETSVASFAPQGTEAERLLQYPFARPEGSFYTDGETVTVLPDNYQDFYGAAEEMLHSQGLPGLAKRAPVVAYGANVSPGKLAEKMSKYGGEAIQPELQAVPMLSVDVPDSQVVWHGKPGQSGSVFAELYKGPETVGTAARAVVQFLTNEQIALLHATEGVTYHFAPTEVRTLDGTLLPAIAYVAGRSSMLMKDSKPVTVKLPSTGESSSMTAREAVSFMLKHAGEALGVELPEDLIALNAGKTLAQKKAHQAAIESGLREQELSRTFSHPDQESWHYGRADFNDLHNVGHNPAVLHLAEESLARLRPGREAIEQAAEQIAIATGVPMDEARQKARVKLDIMHSIRNRHRAELQERLDENKS